MPADPRFHLDESVTPAIASGLINRNRDCTTTQSAGLLHASDKEQLAYCKTEGRILITADQDFLSLVSHEPDHPGLIYWSTQHHFGTVIKKIDEMCMTMTADEYYGRVFYL